MPRYEYKVVPAPSKGIKGKGVRGAEARFSFAIQELMNGMAGYGWEYQRAETLPSVERSGLTGSTTEWRNVLVFRRPREGDAAAFQPELLPAPTPDESPAPDPMQSPPNTAPSDEMSDLADEGMQSTPLATKIGASLSLLAHARSKADQGGEVRDATQSETQAAPDTNKL